MINRILKTSVLATALAFSSASQAAPAETHHLVDAILYSCTSGNETDGRIATVKLYSHFQNQPRPHFGVAILAKGDPREEIFSWENMPINQLKAEAKKYCLTGGQPEIKYTLPPPPGP